MILELILGGVMLGQYIYHRFTETDPPKPQDRIKVPIMSEGANIPLVFGRCRVHTPVVIWYGNASGAQRIDQPAGMNIYQIDIVFALGIPFPNGNTLLQGIYVDGHRISDAAIFNFAPNLAGSIGLADNNSSGVDENGPEWTAFQFEFGDGSTTQVMDSSFTKGVMINGGIDATLVPGFRGYSTLLVYKLARNAATLPVFSFELSTYPSTFNYFDQESVGLEANPIDVIQSLLCDRFAKIGMSPANVYNPSFLAAAIALREEGHGYSRAFENDASADEVIQEILKQIDAVLYEDPIDGLIKIRLIRDDYVPADCLLVNPDNCKELQSPAAGGWTGRANKIRLVFTDRSKDYEDGSATAQNMANAVGQDGLVEEVVIQMPGICTQALADDIAGRELAARSRPMFKCSAVVDRSFLRVVPGDVVALTWPEWHISGMLMRVAGVTRGGLEDGAIKLDLIQDFFYARRLVFVDGGSHGTIGGFPGTILG